MTLGSPESHPPHPGVKRDAQQCVFYQLDQFPNIIASPAPVAPPCIRTDPMRTRNELEIDAHSASRSCIQGETCAHNAPDAMHTRRPCVLRTKEKNEGVSLSRNPNTSTCTRKENFCVRRDPSQPTHPRPRRTLGTVRKGGRKKRKSQLNTLHPSLSDIIDGAIHACLGRRL